MQSTHSQGQHLTESYMPFKRGASVVNAYIVTSRDLSLPCPRLSYLEVGVLYRLRK